MFFKLSKQKCIYTPLTLSDEEKGEIGKLPIFNEKGKIKNREHEGISQITRAKGEALSRQNPESFIMNNYTTLPSAVGGEDLFDSKKPVGPTLDRKTDTKPNSSGSDLSPNLTVQGKESLIKDNLAIEEKCALAKTVVKRIGRNNKNLYNITFDGPNPFNIFEMKSDVTKNSDYRTMTFK